MIFIVQIYPWYTDTNWTEKNIVPPLQSKKKAQFEDLNMPRKL